MELRQIIKKIQQDIKCLKHLLFEIKNNNNNNNVVLSYIHIFQDFINNTVVAPFSQSFISIGSLQYNTTTYLGSKSLGVASIYSNTSTNSGAAIFTQFTGLQFTPNQEYEAVFNKVSDICVTTLGFVDDNNRNTIKNGMYINIYEDGEIEGIIVAKNTELYRVSFDYYINNFDWYKIKIKTNNDENISFQLYDNENNLIEEHNFIHNNLIQFEKYGTIALSIVTENNEPQELINIDYISFKYLDNR